jgi:hypothetical protein|tara:strand:- start:301 stop:549 length:249 start_codon:yes stop_codon:yes gene_type:complete
MTTYYSRQQLIDNGQIDAKPYSIVSDAYIALHNDVLNTVHIPHSDVYYVRAALEKHSNIVFPLDVVENAMKANGWKDRKFVV